MCCRVKFDRHREHIESGTVEPPLHIGTKCRTPHIEGYVWDAWRGRNRHRQSQVPVGQGISTCNLASNQGLRRVAPGNDFGLLGWERQLEWFWCKIQSEFESNTEVAWTPGTRPQTYESPQLNHGVNRRGNLT